MIKASPKKILSIAFNIFSSTAEKILPLLYYIIIISTISGVAGAFFSVSYLKSPGPLKEASTIIIPSGTSVIGISRMLGQMQIIELPQLFAIIIKLSQSGKSLKAGEYAFAPGIAPMEVFTKIEAGAVVVRKITIPEGLSTFQIIDLIKKDPALSGEVPENLAEGELLPETYEYHYGDNRAVLIRRMQEAMRQTLDILWENRLPGLPLKTRQEALVLASIIEKETALPDERKRVAAVFINRLKKNMRLQTDPSVIYALTNGKYILDRPLSHKDLEINSPYNTYLIPGLPPTPIANPGKASIEAALNPLATDELYFVANGNGGHAFSNNLQQHNNNVINLRKLEKAARQENNQPTTRPTSK